VDDIRRHFVVKKCSVVANLNPLKPNQPIKKLTKGGVLRKAQGDVRCSVKPFLFTKRTAGIGKQCLINYNWGCANGIVVLAEGLDVFRLGAIATGGRMIPSGNLSFVKRTVWMNVWD
jgi:hypothetical protein